jgi:DNA-binding cell septation regulator SpoVG
MKVTEVNVTPVKPDDGLVAFASCVIDNQLYIGSIGIHKLLDGSGYRITYPTKKVGTRQMNYFHPLTTKAHKAIQQAIAAKCYEVFEKSDEDDDRYSKTTDKREQPADI